MPRPTRWRAFASARYRPFHAIAVGQAFTISFASDALFVPLLLRLGAHPSLVILVGAAPTAGAALQALAPQVLRRMRGNLRRLTVVLALAELRGFVLASIVAAAAAGWIGSPAAIALVALTVVVGQTLGVLSGSNIGLWTAILLPETERRLVGPRMGALSMALSTLILLPGGIALDSASRAIGLWAFAGFFCLGGLASTLTPLAVLRLPRPGRVLVSRAGEGRAEIPAAFDRFIVATSIGYFGQGVLPYLSLYAMRVLGMSAGFALLLSGVASAGALVGSLSVGSFLLVGSASRTLRATFLARAGAAAMCASALPGNPAAPVLLLAGSALFNGAGNAGMLATNERLFRLAPADVLVRCQGRLALSTAGAVFAGAATGALALAVAGPAATLAYTGLFIASGASRTVAALRTEVSASWLPGPPTAALPATVPPAPAEPLAETLAPAPGLTRASGGR